VETLIRADKERKLSAFHLPLRAVQGSARFAVCVQNRAPVLILS